MSKLQNGVFFKTKQVRSLYNVGFDEQNAIADKMAVRINAGCQRQSSLIVQHTRTDRAVDSVP